MVFYERNGDDIDRGLVGYWKLDDKKSGSSTAIDRANFNDGTITGTTNTTGINGLNPDAILFDTSFTNEIVMSDGSLFAFTDNFTITAWISPTEVDVGDLAPIFSQAIFNVGEDQTSGYLVGHTPITNVLIFRYNDFSSVSSVNTININVWQHVAFILRNGVVEFYINGVREISSNIGIINQFDSDPPKIGRATTGDLDDQHYQGGMSLLRVYNRALTSGEISKLYRLRK